LTGTALANFPHFNNLKFLSSFCCVPMIFLSCSMWARAIARLTSTRRHSTALSLEKPACPVKLSLRHAKVFHNSYLCPPLFLPSPFSACRVPFLTFHVSGFRRPSPALITPASWLRCIYLRPLPLTSPKRFHPWTSEIPSVTVWQIHRQFRPIFPAIPCIGFGLKRLIDQVLPPPSSSSIRPSFRCHEGFKSRILALFHPFIQSLFPSPFIVTCL